MDGGILTWYERIIAGLGLLLGVLYSYMMHRRRRSVSSTIDNRPIQTSAEAAERIVSEEIQQQREEFVSEVIHSQVPALVEEAKENSKDAKTAAAALENSQL